MIPTEILNLGAVAILFFLFMKEFFSYLKTKKGGNRNEKYEKALGSINEKLGNHLTDVNKNIASIRIDVASTNKEMEGVQRDLAIVKDNVNDIKIRIK